MPQNVSKQVKCPYYKWNKDDRISCEGVDRTNGIMLIFHSPTDLKEYCKKYCNDIFNYKKCLLCRMQNQRYGEEE